MHEALYRRAINEAEQAGWNAVQQAHRLNRTSYEPNLQTARTASKLYDREIIFLNSILGWYHDDDTHAWLHLDKYNSAKKKTLRTRMKDLLNRVTQPPQLPVDPILPNGHWENHLHLSPEKKTKNTHHSNCAHNN